MEMTGPLPIIQHATCDIVHFATNETMDANARLIIFRKDYTAISVVIRDLTQAVVASITNITTLHE